MNAHEFKQGDVAMIRDTHTGITDEWSAVRDGKGWASLDPSIGWVANDDVITARALVIIDPEDREQVGRLADAYERQDLGTFTDDMQAALIGLIAPPKPEEPTGLGAVVECEDGATWVRTHKQVMNAWTRAGFGNAATYADIDAVRVLSEGVTA